MTPVRAARRGDEKTRQDLTSVTLVRSNANLRGAEAREPSLWKRIVPNDRYCSALSGRRWPARDLDDGSAAPKGESIAWHPDSLPNGPSPGQAHPGEDARAANTVNFGRHGETFLDVFRGSILSVSPLTRDAASR